MTTLWLGAGGRPGAIDPEARGDAEARGPSRAGGRGRAGPRRPGPHAVAAAGDVNVAAADVSVVAVVVVKVICLKGSDMF